jgi:hypothetical protein
MRRTRTRAARSLPALTLIIIAGWMAGERLYAGPLAPPAGPIASTNKTLTEVEPRIALNATHTPGDADSLLKITAPGSYYLTGNITGAVGKHGIEIGSGASGVTIDLNGFDLAGVPGSLDGVAAPINNIRGVTIVNGTIRNWGGDGIDLASFATFNIRVEGVTTSGNGGFGIYVYLNASVINCCASFNSSYGIYANDGCAVSDCTVSHNGSYGIYAGLGCTVSNCTSQYNTGSGIRTVDGCVVVDCVARGNTEHGIVAFEGNIIRNNACQSNGVTAVGAGILVDGADNRIEDNNCTLADRGINVTSAGNVIIRNACAGNTTDWVIVANNIYGPIIDRRAPASAAVSGFSAASTLGSTEPSANFSY